LQVNETELKIVGSYSEVGLFNITHSTNCRSWEEEGSRKW